VRAFPDTSFDNPEFKEQLLSLHNRLPGYVEGFYKNGLLYYCLSSLSLNCVLELLLKEADEEVVASLWRLFLMYDGPILGPFRKGAQLASVIKERAGLFLAGDWDPLFSEHLQFRDPSAHRPPSDAPFLSNLLGAKAKRTQLHVLNNQSLGSAASALRANPYPAPLAAGDVTASFWKLNPQVGGDIPRPSEAHSLCGPQTEAEQLKSTEWQRSVGLEPGDSTASTWKRRPPSAPPRRISGPCVLLFGGSAATCAPHQQILSRGALGLQLQDNASVVLPIRLSR